MPIGREEANGLFDVGSAILGKGRAKVGERSPLEPHWVPRKRFLAKVSA